MGTLEILGFIIIGVALGFILTKGVQLEKSIKEKSKKVREEREKVKELEK